MPVDTAIVAVPVMPGGDITLEVPPNKETSQGMGNVLSTLLPMMGSMGVMVFMAVSNSTKLTSLLTSAAMVVAMLGMAGINLYRQISSHRDKVMTMRREYLAYLAETRATVRSAAELQRRATVWDMPPPTSLVLVAAQGVRVWERDASSTTLLRARVGVADQHLSMELVVPEMAPLADPDPVCYSALNSFVATHSIVEGLPLGVDLGPLAHLEAIGDLGVARPLVRALIAHLATFVSPDLLKIAVLCSERVRPEWDWVKWLPHARSDEVIDDAGPARLVNSRFEDLAAMLGDDIATRPTFAPRTATTAWPHLLLVVDDADLPVSTRLGSVEGAVGVTVLPLMVTWGMATSATTGRLVCRPSSPGQVDDRVDVILAGKPPLGGVADAMTVTEAEAVARRLTPWTGAERPDDTVAAVGLADPKRSADLAELLGLGDVRDFTPARDWPRRTGHDLLRVPFGVTPEGIPVLLDIKESAQGGMGPHGLLVGATGSGKSEVLRTLVLALALTHSPEQLNFVLVDFKGGATFGGMADLPHVSAMISNLESDLGLVDRMADALKGEITRRYELLSRAGNLASVTEYEAARLAGEHQGPPLPALFIILDEFSELLSAKPEFIDVFVQIGRVGRSLSIHLLLSSQRLEENKLKGLDSHLSYRIGLRTFSAAESKTVLGNEAAYALPPLPGVGYLKPGTDQLIRFRACYVAAPPTARAVQAAQEARPAAAPIRTVVPFTSAPVHLPPPAGFGADDPPPPPEVRTPPAPGRGADEGARRAMPDADERWRGMTQMAIGVALMAGEGPKAHQVWLPPLEIPATMDMVLGDVAVDPVLGLVSKQWRERGPLIVPVGLVDVPLEQRREPLVFDLSGAGGNVAVIGGPLSGKSTFLRSLVLGVCATRTSREAQFYVIDFGGGTFLPFDGAPHVAAVVTRDQPAVLVRLIAEVTDIMDRREAFFREHRIDSMAAYRARRARGELDDGHGDVFLVVDNWATLRADHETHEAAVAALAARGLGFGVHVIVSSGRWMDLRQAVIDVMGGRFELRLGDPASTVLDRALALAVPEGRPGRGQAGRHHALVALPRLDHDQRVATLAAGVADALASIDQAWSGAPAPRLQVLPARIGLDQLRALAVGESRIILGQEESHLGLLTFDPAGERHLMVLGDAQSGKTTMLRSLTEEIMRVSTPQQAQIFVVDLRRTMLGEVPADYRGGYMATRDDAQDLLGGVAAFLTTRLPGRDVTADQLRARSWWSGPEAWVLIDDYDLVATASGNPVALLSPLLAQSGDVGLHVVIARRAGGAARHMYEPVMQTLIDLATTGVLLSGSPDEGLVLSGVKFRRAEPGRAQVVHRDLGRIVAQMAWSAPRS
ncbi:MAG: type VII secretion protein EccCa [Actinomycetia bacterium]|nr:type VII secretion protein EccCa [Actinomycetes bacterium]